MRQIHSNQQRDDYEYLLLCTNKAQQGVSAWRTLQESEQLLTALILGKPRWLELMSSPLGVVLALTPRAWIQVAGLIAVPQESETPRPDSRREEQVDSIVATQVIPHQPEKALLRLKDVLALTGLSRSTIYQLEKQGEFCGRVQVTQKRVAWRSEDVHAWIAARKRKVGPTERRPRPRSRNNRQAPE